MLNETSNYNMSSEWLQAGYDKNGLKNIDPNSTTVKILEYILDNPGCKRYDILKKIVSRYKSDSFSNRDMRGQYSYIFSSLNKLGLISQDKKTYGMTLTDKGKKVLQNAYTNKSANKINGRKDREYGKKTTGEDQAAIFYQIFDKNFKKKYNGSWAYYDDYGLPETDTTKQDYIKFPADSDFTDIEREEFEDMLRADSSGLLKNATIEYIDTIKDYWGKDCDVYKVTYGTPEVSESTRRNKMRKLNLTKEQYNRSRYFRSKYGSLKYVSESGRLFKTNKGHILLFKESEGWFGIPNASFIDHGSWSDPEIIYDGISLNYYDVEEMLLDEYRGEHPEDTEDEGFDDWMGEPDTKESIQSVLDILAQDADEAAEEEDEEEFEDDDEW